MGEAQQLEALAYSNMGLDATGTIILIPQEASGLLIGDALVGEELLPAETPVVCQEPCVEVASAPQQQASASQCLFQGLADVVQRKRTTLSPRIVTRAVKMRWLDELLEQKQIACPIVGCQARFTSMGTVERHYLSCPGVEGSGMEKCPYCDEQFLTFSNALQEHIPEEHPTMKALLHSEAPRKRPFGAYRRRRTHNNNEPPAKRAPDPVPSTREFEVRRRTYSRAWDQPVGPTSELFRRPQMGDDDPLQLPRDCVNQQDVTLSSEELALDENHLAEEEQPSSHESPLSILDTASLPRVPFRQSTPRPRGNKTNRRLARPSAPNPRTVQVIVRSERPSSDLLRDPQLLDALGDLATRTEQPQERVAVHAAATAGGRYLQTELAQRPILERSEVDRFFGVVKVDSACQTDDLPLPRPRVSPAILKKPAPRLYSAPAQAASAPTPPAVPAAIPKSIAVSIVCANRGYSSDEDEFSMPVSCPEEATDHALLHLPAPLQLPLVAAVPAIESAVEEEYGCDHLIEPVQHEPVEAFERVTVPNAEGIREESLRSNRDEGAEFDADHSKKVETGGAALSVEADSAESMLEQGFVGGPFKDAMEDAPVSVTSAIQVYAEGIQVQGSLVNAVKENSEAALMANSSDIPNQGSASGALMEAPMTSIVQGDHEAAPLLDSLNNPDRDNQDRALGQDSVASLSQSNMKDLVLDSLNIPSQDNTGLPQGSLANPAGHSAVDVVFDSIDNSNNTIQSLGEVSAVSPPQCSMEEGLLLNSISPIQESIDGATVQVSAVNPVADSTEEDLVSNSVGNPRQEDTVRGNVQDSAVNSAANNTEQDLVLDSIGDPDQDDTEGPIVRGSAVNPFANSTDKDLVSDSLGNSNEDDIEGPIVRDPAIKPLANSTDGDLASNSVGNSNQDNTEGTIAQDSAVILVLNCAVENMVSDSIGNRNQGDTKGPVIQGSVVSPVPNTADENLVLDSIGNPNQGDTEGPVVQCSAVSPVPNSADENLMLDSIGNPNQGDIEGPIVQVSAVNPMANSAEEDLVLDSIGNPGQDETEGPIVQDSAVNPTANTTEEDLVIDSIGNPNQDDSKGAIVPDSVANTVASSTKEDLVLHSMCALNQNGSGRDIALESVANPMRDDSAEGLVLNSIDIPNQDGAEGTTMESAVVYSVQNEAEAALHPDYMSGSSQGGSDGNILRDSLSNPIQGGHAEISVTSSYIEPDQSATKDLTQDSLITSVQDSSKQVEGDGNTMEELYAGSSKSTEDNNSQPDLSMDLDVELEGPSADTTSINEAESQSACADNELRDGHMIVTVTSTVPSADSTVSIEPCEERQVDMGLVPVPKASCEKSGEGLEHVIDEDVGEYGTDNTNNTTVGQCLQPTAEIAPCLVAPDTEHVEVPDRTVFSIQPYTEANLPTDEMHAGSATEESARSISEFCDHIDASAQVWVAKMREQLNAETEMEYESHTQDVEAAKSCLASGRPLPECAVRQNEYYRLPLVHTVKDDAGRNSSDGFEAINFPQIAPDDVGHPTSGTPSDIPAEGCIVPIKQESAKGHEPSDREPGSGSRPEAEPARDRHEPPTTTITHSRPETQSDVRQGEDTCHEKGGNHADVSELLPKVCAEPEVEGKIKGSVVDNTCTDAVHPAQGMPCEEECDLSVGREDSFQSLHCTSSGVLPEELNPSVLKMDCVDQQPLEVDHQKEVDTLEISTDTVELKPQPEISPQPVHAQIELHLQSPQDDSLSKDDTQTQCVDPQPEVDLPMKDDAVPVTDTQQVQVGHISDVVQPAGRDHQSGSEGPRSPLAVRAQPVEMELQLVTSQDSVATNPDACAQADETDSHQTTGAETDKHLKGDDSNTPDISPVLVPESEVTAQTLPVRGPKQEEKMATESSLWESQTETSETTVEDCNEKKQIKTEGGVTEEQKMEIDVTTSDGVSNNDGVRQEDRKCVMDKLAESSHEGELSVKGKSSIEEADSRWVDDEEDTRSSGEALLHIVESMPDDGSPMEDSNDQPQDDDHFLGASGGRPSSRSRSRRRAASVAKKIPNSGRKRKEVAAKKGLPPKDSRKNVVLAAEKEQPPKDSPKSFVRRKPRFQLNLDFPDGTPLTCSACKSVFTEKNLVVDHILHEHYNLARVNDDREMSDKERRSALLQASKVISRFKCKNGDCNASFATYISYYTHLSRCSLAPTPLGSAVKSECDEQPEEEDDCEVPRKKRRSALKALESFSNLVDERPPSRESEAAEFSDDSSALSLSDDPLSDWSLSSGDEDSLSALQSWRGRFKAPDMCTEKLPEGLVKNWVRGTRCPNKGCTKEFQTSVGLKYHFPRCGQGSYYECCRCGLATIKNSGAMLRHLRACYQDKPKGDISKKKKRSKMMSRKPHELLQYTVEFQNKHYAKDMLYKEWRPIKWHPLSNSGAELYLPVFRESPALRLGDTTWNTMKLFEVSHQRAHSTLFVGGAVWAAAWCPAPKDVEQWVAVACCPDPDIEWPVVAADQSPCNRGLLQIWNLGKLSGSDCDPKPALLLAHDWGPILDIAWCPSGCWEPPGTGQRLGLLALACSDGSVRIISVPHEMPATGDIVVYGGVVPSAILESPAGLSLCTRLAWYPAKGHSLFAAGYGNGMVSLYDLQTSSDLLRGTSPDGSSLLQPLQVIQAHLAAITGLAWNHCTYEPFLASSSIDRSAKLWNMNNPAVPVTLFRRGMLRSLAMCQHWNGMFLSGDETYTSSRAVTLYRENGYYNYAPKSLASHCYASWWVSVSDWLNMAAACDVGGHVSAISLPFLTGNLDSTRKHRHGCVLIYQTNMVPLDASIPTPQDTTNHAVAVKHFGLKFQDSPLDSWNSDRETKGYAAAPNQYHLNSINTVSWNPNGLVWLLSGGQAGIVRLSWLGLLVDKKSKSS